MWKDDTSIEQLNGNIRIISVEDKITKRIINLQEPIKNFADIILTTLLQYYLLALLGEMVVKVAVDAEIERRLQIAFIGIRLVTGFVEHGPK